MANLLKRKLIIGGVSGLLLLALGVGTMWALSENQGTTIATPERPTTRRVTADQRYDGSYVAFDYGPGYMVQRLEAKDNDLELAMLTASTNFDKRLAVAVSKLTGAGLSGNSAYLLRQSQPSRYEQTIVTVAGAPAEAWTTTDGRERVVFIPNGDKVATLSFTTAGNEDDIVTESYTLLKSFEWKR